MRIRARTNENDHLSSTSGSLQSAVPKNAAKAGACRALTRGPQHAEVSSTALLGPECACKPPGDLVRMHTALGLTPSISNLVRLVWQVWAHTLSSKALIGQMHWDR